MEVGVLKTEAERLRKKKLRVCLWADREEEGRREQTVTEGVSVELSWASKPITGNALIEAALEGLIYTSSLLIHWSGDGNVSTTNRAWMAIGIHYAVNGTNPFISISVYIHHLYIFNLCFCEIWQKLEGCRTSGWLTVNSGFLRYLSGYIHTNNYISYGSGQSMCFIIIIRTNIFFFFFFLSFCGTSGLYSSVRMTGNRAERERRRHAAKGRRTRDRDYGLCIWAAYPNHCATGAAHQKKHL